MTGIVPMDDLELAAFMHTHTPSRNAAPQCTIPPTTQQHRGQHRRLPRCSTSQISAQNSVRTFSRPTTN
jgi:hypothetical protein